MFLLHVCNAGGTEHKREYSSIKEALNELRYIDIVKYCVALTEQIDRIPVDLEGFP